MAQGQGVGIIAQQETWARVEHSLLQLWQHLIIISIIIVTTIIIIIVTSITAVGTLRFCAKVSWALGKVMTK